MRGIRSRLTYANVVSTVAVFLVVTGGVAYAADTIFSADIVDGEVKAADIGTSQILSADLRNNQIKSTDVRDDSFGGGGLTGADIGDNAIGKGELAAGSVEATAPAAIGPDSVAGGVPLLFKFSSGGGAATFTAPRDMRLIDVWLVNGGNQPGGTGPLRLVRAGLCEHFPPPIATVPVSGTSAGDVNRANFIDPNAVTFTAGQTFNVCFPAVLVHVYILAEPM